jgi:uncharacterized metal-binding protein
MKKINKIIFLNIAAIGFLYPLLKFSGCDDSIISFVGGVFVGCLLGCIADFIQKTIKESKIKQV